MGKYKKVVFDDDTRKVTLTRNDGTIFSFKAKPRTPITLKLLLKVPAMAVFEYGERRDPTENEKAQAIIDILKMSIDLNLLKKEL